MDDPAPLKVGDSIAYLFYDYAELRPDNKTHFHLTAPSAHRNMSSQGVHLTWQLTHMVDRSNTATLETTSATHGLQDIAE